MNDQQSKWEGKMPTEKKIISKIIEKKKKKEESQSTQHTLNIKQITDTMLTLTAQDMLTMLRT